MLILGIFIGVPIGYVVYALINANKKEVRVDYFRELEE